MESESAISAVERICRQAEWRLARVIENNVVNVVDPEITQSLEEQSGLTVDPGLSGVSSISVPGLSGAERLGQAQVELEARVGIINSSGRFETGISPQLHQQFYQKMPKNNECSWFKSHDIEETHDYFYMIKNNEQDSHKQVRDTVHYNSDGLVVEHIVKQNVAKVDIEVPSVDCDIRISLSTEEPINVESLPDEVSPHLVRIKRRHLFEYISREMKQTTFNFVFTWSWSGKSREEAEMNQRQKPFDPVCEFEVECIHPMRYRQFHNQQYRFVAESLLRKVLGFLATGTQSSFQAENHYLPLLKLRQVCDLDNTGAVVPVWKSNPEQSKKRRIGATGV